MPAVKVFNIFGGQKPAEKQPTSPPAHGAMQKFYRTFSVAPENSTEHKVGKVTAIAACLEKRISDPAVVCGDNVQKLINKVNINDTVNGIADDLKIRDHAYENVNIVSAPPFTNNLLDETKGYSSIYENVTVVGKLSNCNKEDSKTISESKLSKALESFDKILSEFSATETFKSSLNINNSNFCVPKLQKSKTCSIIESRCILKKTISDPETERKTQSQVKRNNSIDKTTSLWNLDDMKGKELTSPLKPLAPSINDKMSPDKYATYKISSKNSTRSNCIKTEELKKMDVKTRILKKTLSNPPSTPIPVVTKPKPVTKKYEKKVIDPKKIKTKSTLDMKNISDNTQRSQMQKAKSVWEIGNETMIPPNLERTKSSTSIAGSPSKIPVIRGQMSQNKFSSTRALFSPTPVDLHDIDQARECAQKKKPIASRKTTEKPDQTKQVKQKSQLNLKSDSKRQYDKTKKDVVDKKAISSHKTTLRDYSDEINAVRAKLQQKKNNNKKSSNVEMRESKQNETEPATIGCDLSISPVKYIVKKLECKTATESKTEPAYYVNCKVIPPVYKELCVANTTLHNHLSTLVGRQIKYVEPREDSKTYSQTEKLPLLKHSEEKISDTHSDCSDDSGHVSNDAANDNDVVFDNIHDVDVGSIQMNVDEIDCKMFDGPKQFRTDLPGDAKSVCPVRPARRGERGERANEVASGTRVATDSGAPKVDEQIRLGNLTFFNTTTILGKCTTGVSAGN